MMSSSQWPRVPLSDIARTSSGGTPSRKNAAFYDGPHPWVKIGDLNDADVLSAETSITDAGLKASSAKLLEPGVLLIAMYGSIGKLGVLRIRAATNQAICAVRADEELVLTDYLFWFFLGQRHALTERGRGGAQLNISQGDLKAWEVPLPPIETQREIVSSIEAHMEIARRAEQSLEEARANVVALRKSILHQAFSQPEGASDV